MRLCEVRVFVYLVALAVHDFLYPTVVMRIGRHGSIAGSGISLNFMSWWGRLGKLLFGAGDFEVVLLIVGLL